MTSVGTGVVAGSSASSLVDFASTRSGGANTAPEGGFDALFSRTLEADEQPTVPTGGRDQAGRELEREAMPLRADRAPDASRRRDVANGDRRVRSADRADGAARGDQRSDSAAAASTDDVVAVDQTDDSSEAENTGDGADTGVQMGAVMAAVPTAGAAIATNSATPSLAPGLAIDGQAANATGEASSTGTGASVTSVSTAQPAAPTAPAAAAPTAPAAGAEGAQAFDQVPVLPTEGAVVDPASPVDAESSAMAGPAVEMPANGGSVETTATITPGPAADPALGPTSPEQVATTEAITAVAPSMSAEVVEAAAVATVERPAPLLRSDDSPAPSGAPQRLSSTTESMPAATHTAGPAAPRPAGASSAPSGAPQGAEQLADLQRMRERAALSGLRGGSMSVDLSDEGLGQLTLHAQQGAGGLHLTLSAADSATRDLLSRQQAALRSDLEASGATLGSLDIQHAGARSSDRRGGGSGEQSSVRSGITSTGTASSAASPVGTLARSRRAPSSDGVDLLI